MTTRFLQSRIWDKVTALARSAVHRHVAVAYLGTGASNILPLSRGDLLVVDMSSHAVRAGETSPYEVEIYLNRQVEVHSCSNLHAKVFVFDGKAIIGSANASRNSRDYLVEAALITTDKAAVTQARGFVRSLTGERVTPAHVKASKRQFRKDRAAQPPALKGPNGTPAHPRLWVGRIHDVRRDPKREQADEAGWRLAQSRLTDKRLFEIESLSEPADTPFSQRAAIGDLLVEVWRAADGALRVYPPSRIVNTRAYRSSRGARKKLYFLETPKSPTPIPWRAFRAVLSKGGIAKPSQHIDREIKSPVLKHMILGLW